MNEIKEEQEEQEEQEKEVYLPISFSPNGWIERGMLEVSELRSFYENEMYNEKYSTIKVIKNGTEMIIAWNAVKNNYTINDYLKAKMPEYLI